MSLSDDAFAHSSPIRHVAALGSSFAAGPGIRPVANRQAMRSERNYPHLLAARLGARLTDLSVSGATTATICDTPQRRARRTFPAQASQLPSDADLVTVTAGGNDLHYLGSMMRLAYAATFADHLLTRRLGARFARLGVPEVGVDDIDRATAGLVAVVTAVRDRAPGARVLLVDYLTILSSDTDRRQSRFDTDTRDRLAEIGRRLTGAFAAAAAHSGAEFVDIGVQSRDHAVGSHTPWVSPFSARHPAGSFHPNLAGMEAVTDAIVAHLKTRPPAS